MSSRQHTAGKEAKEEVNETSMLFSDGASVWDGGDGQLESFLRTGALGRHVDVEDFLCREATDLCAEEE